MALNYNYVAVISLIVVIGIKDIFCADGTIAQQPSQINNPWHRLDTQPDPIGNGLKSTTTPWPELGQRRGQQASHRRDFVSTPTRTISTPSTPFPALVHNQQTAAKRDFVSSPRPNINQRISNNAGAATSTDSKRDFVSNVNQGVSNNAGAAISTDNKRDFVSNQRTNINQGGPVKSQEAPTWVRPTTPSNKRDFVSNPRPNVNQGASSNAGAAISTDNKRDFVSNQHTNINQGGPVKSPEAPTWVRPTTPSNKRDFVSSPRTNVNQAATTSSNRRDYASSVVNNQRGPNLPNNGLKLTPSGNRDYVSSPQTVQNKPGFSAQNVNNKNVIPPPISSTGPKVESTPGDNKLQEDNELREFSETLLKKDVNNAVKFVKINYQGKTRSSSTNDEAPEPLLTIHPDAYNLPSVEKLIALHNNYILESHNNEVYTAQEKIEENNFLDTILPTSVMQHTRNFLVQKGKIPKDPKAFRDLLKTIWFNMYSRGGGKIGSSGFEHVFVAEIKNGEPSGLHNWIYFNAEEKKNTANYLGYMKKLEFEKGAIVKFHFNFHNKDKPVGSMFIGTSPELEFALYSTCFIMRADGVCPLSLGGNNFIIRTYTYRYRGKNMIGSAFPDI